MNDYQRIARVIEYLDEHYLEQPDLRTLAGQVKLSPHHFHRLFSRWAGITPKDFLQCLTLSHARVRLRAGRSVLETALDAGLSGPGRLHDLCVSLEAASPGELKSGGTDWTITAGFADSPFGTCLVGTGPRGICHLSFVESTSRRRALATINCDWPHARVEWDDEDAAKVISPLFETPPDRTSRLSIRAFVRGTLFQVRVWRALLQVPRGRVVSYGRLAEKVCTPAAARAVGGAVAANPLAYLIPCHRVIRETGVVGEYRWGRTRKKAILAWESSAREVQPT
jgi:AraC family transcriptional regulator, regulatory protein of adaptative response / methylated-DNA-[protein]-cysteine methyltransferase